MEKTININLFDQKSIQAAVKALRDYENSLEYKCRLLAETLAEKGVEIARVQIADLDAIFTSELLQSIHSEYVGSVKGGGVWAVVAGTDHALFVEFGTLGSMGGKKEYPYPLPEGVQWNYGSGSHIMQVIVKFIYCLIYSFIIFSADKLNRLSVSLTNLELYPLISMILNDFVCYILI